MLAPVAILFPVSLENFLVIAESISSCGLHDLSQRNHGSYENDDGPLFLGYMVPIIRLHKGFIDKYIGDAIMALFPGNADDALACAIAMIISKKSAKMG